MPKGLSYVDAVRILGGPGPLAKTVDNLLGGLLSVATAGGSEVALSFFDAKAEMVRLGALVTTRITDVVRGLGRYNRSERLLAASGVLVVASMFEALDDCLRAAGLETAEFTADDQLILVGAPAGAAKSLSPLLVGPIPQPSPTSSYADLLNRVRGWCDGLSFDLIAHLAGLAVWDRADETAHARFIDQMTESLGARAAAHYDESHRRLAEEIPEFAIWSGRLEARATAHSLQRLENLLARASSLRHPGRHRAALFRAYHAKLNRPVLAGDAGELVLPDLGDIYVDPRFQVKVAGPGARPSEESWWNSEVRDDIHDLFATYLTTTDAAVTPLLLLGQPGAGKSSLTHILAARLPAADYLVARVPLREVPAEAEIQDQIELSIRTAIGESVAWAEMAEDAGRPLAVVLLDGFDELLQATGLHQSDYLQRVAAFQERELAQNRPVAVIVTSRVVVADRARIPPGSLIVRLEPFDRPQIREWLTVWNRANPSAGPLPVEALDPLHDLAAQPLLLLMLALYHAGGNPLTDDFDRAQLYERLLGEFATREVRRLHAGRPEPAIAELVETELLRLSVVAFAMFHRNRLWVTQRELDDDLAGLGLTPTRTVGTESFRTPLTAAEEMVGRFFFIQRAQAMRDDKTFRTYEFLHATFGEYLVARLVVRAVRDAAARENAATLTLGLGRPPGPDLLQDLLGYTPLTARNTVLQFVRFLLDTADRDAIRDFLMHRTRRAVTRPDYTPGNYRPIDKRIDHWMATYSFNLVFLTLACGGEIRATDLYETANDPADWLRGTALQWRAAIPGGMMTDALETVTVRRETRDGRRDLVLTPGHRPWPDSWPPLDPAWSNRRRSPEHDGLVGYFGGFTWGAAMTSMHLGNSLSDDALLHAMEPLVRRLPHASRYFVVHESGETESIAHSLMRLWVTAGLGDDRDALADAYVRAVDALLRPAGFAEAGEVSHLLLRSLRNDAARLDPEFVVVLVRRISAGPIPGDDLFADVIRTLLVPFLREAGPRWLGLVRESFRSLLNGLERIESLRDTMDRLEESGDLAAVLEGAGNSLNPRDLRLLSTEVRETRPHLAHLIR